MPTALVYDQNPALQVQANHALKINGFDPISRTGGPLAEIVEELSPELIITTPQHLITLRSALLAYPFYTVLISDELSSKPKLPFSALLQRPFKTERLTEAITRLKALTLLPIAGQVSLLLENQTWARLLELALHERGVSVKTGPTLFTITDKPQAEQFGEQLLIQDFSHPLSESLLRYPEAELKLEPPPKQPMPMTENEAQLLRRTLLKALEGSLAESKAFRRRQWDTVVKELNLVFSELFHR
jgi:hypothetical protein